ncbi:cohesin domain-containing protein [Porticoccaceae bacterium]|nr:cohesin domain-containing protein [Porticoccaceae bacterium]
MSHLRTMSLSLSKFLSSFKSIKISSVFVLASSVAFVASADEASVSFTVSLPTNVSSVRLHSEALGWDVNHPGGVAINNGDGTWTATIPVPWAASTNYKWMANGVEENLKDDVDAGYCANDGLNSGDWGANRVYLGAGNVAGDMFGKCSETPTDAGVILNIPQVAALAPAAPQYSVISVFSDSYNDVVDDFRAEWSEAQTVLTSAFIGDNNILKYSNMGFVGIDIPDPIDASSYESFHADVWSPVDATVRVEIINTSNDDFYFYTKASYELQLNAGQWKSIDISNLANSDIEGLETIGQLSFNVINNDTKDGILVVDNIYFFDPDAEGQQGVTFTVSKPGANDVRLTGPSWNWSLTTGPVAADNGDGTWTVTMDSPPSSNTEYLWVADNVLECSGDNTANRLWAANSGNVNDDVFDACPPAESTSTDVMFTVAVEGTPSSVRMTGAWWQNWDPDQGPVANDNGDGTWSAFLPLVEESFEYLWIIDGQQEELVDNAVNGECVEEVDADTLNTDYNDYANRQWNPGDGDVLVTFNACAGSPTGLEDSDNDGIIDIEDADDDNDGVDDVNDPLPLDPNFSVMDEAAFINIFGGAARDEATHTYNVANAAQSWAGYANGNQNLYPIAVTVDHLIVFTASVPSGGSADMRFVLESDPHPNNDVVVSADVVEVSGSTETTYIVDLPALGAQQFNSLLMYLDTKDTDVMVKHVALIAESNYDSDGDGTVNGQDAFPNDPSESVDTDNDGIGNNVDTDDDGDNVADIDDGDPLDASVGLVAKQFVSVKGSPSAWLGASANVTIEYNVNTDNSELSGFGFNLHYDSSVLTFGDFADVLAADNISSDGSFNDVTDMDQNPATDKFISAEWNSLSNSWPGELPVELLTLNFNVAEQVTGEATPISFSGETNAAGFEFGSVSYDLPLSLGSLDFDQNGKGDALTDALLLLRYTFKLRGSDLTAGAIASDSPLTAAEVEANVAEAVSSFADIDGSGHIDALTDSLLLLRYLFNLRGEPLVSGAISSGADRSASSDVETYILKRMPQP